MRRFYDSEWLSWSPDITELVLRRKFDKDPDEKELNKIEAVKEVVRSDRFFFEPLVFEKCIRSFNNLPMSFSVWEGLEPREMSYGLHVAKRIAGETKTNKDSVGDGIRAYIAATLAEKPLIYPEPSFEFEPADDYLYRLIGYSADDSTPNRVRRTWKDLAKNTPPNTPQELVSKINAKYKVSNDNSSEDGVLYRNLMRMAMIWTYLHERNISPTE